MTSPGRAPCARGGSDVPRPYLVRAPSHDPLSPAGEAATEQVDPTFQALVAAYQELGSSREEAVRSATRQLAAMKVVTGVAPAGPRVPAPECCWAGAALSLNVGLALTAAPAAALPEHGLLALGVLATGGVLAGTLLGKLVPPTRLART